METIERLRKRIASAEELLAVVRTMKTLASVNVRQYEQSSVALDEYYHTVALGLQIALQNGPETLTVAEPPRTVRVGAVVFGSDQGMCGWFNERIVAYAVDTMDRMQTPREERILLTVGVQALTRLEARQQPVGDLLPVPGSVEGLTPAVQELLLHIEKWRLEQDIEGIVLFYNRQHAGRVFVPHMTQLLPIDKEWLQMLQAKPWPSQVLPFYRMAWRPLFAALIREHFFVSIYHAFAESLASEYASRLASMQAAEHNIGEKLDELHIRYQQSRQSTITNELLDIVSGYTALTRKRA